MKIETAVVGPVGTNCYIVKNEEKKECFLVDPGAWRTDLKERIEDGGYTPQAVLLTHGHFDHIMGLNEVKREYGVPVYALEKELPMLADAELNSSGSLLRRPFTFEGAQGLRDGQELEIAGLKIRVLATPGHTSGGCCYYLPEEKVLFSGDTLFHTSVGRTDLPTGSMSELVRSVKETLFALPDETKVYPGHMDETSIGYEKKYNPFL